MNQSDGSVNLQPLSPNQERYQFGLLIPTPVIPRLQTVHGTRHPLVAQWLSPYNCCLPQIKYWILIGSVATHLSPPKPMPASMLYHHWVKVAAPSLSSCS
ncbi:hypothetical protein DSO57_1012965 [Entomophthora muscae]|uniref:Uncharacterized protein n=1 Tax=Entomophthora muscae TaxID=34485 RepID=A0ACC2TGE4_9FUNG|nr:hypothetical protein DSO57_1012965 [Entomophthora muscae]